MEAVTPTQTSANPEEKIYEDWDCPRVESVEDYEAQDSDEIAIRKGDTANVLRKMSDSGEICSCPSNRFLRLIRVCYQIDSSIMPNSLFMALTTNRFINRKTCSFHSADH